MDKETKSSETENVAKVPPKKRIQTAEGWKRSQLKSQKKGEKPSNTGKTEAA